jgi:hypothetical protein
MSIMLTLIIYTIIKSKGYALLEVKLLQQLTYGLPFQPMAVDLCRGCRGAINLTTTVLYYLCRFLSKTPQPIRIDTVSITWQTSAYTLHSAHILPTYHRAIGPTVVPLAALGHVANCALATFRIEPSVAPSLQLDIGLLSLFLA